jgi:E3 ubiquitin-protein ligase HUWE1
MQRLTVSAQHPQVTELINQLLQTSKDDLPAALGAIDAWTWPRSDLNAWVQVLNKFDEILEDIIREYEIDKVQSKELASIDQELLCSVLRFERLLLENTTNRKSFNSYDVSLHVMPCSC